MINHISVLTKHCYKQKYAVNFLYIMDTGFKRCVLCCI